MVACGPEAPIWACDQDDPSLVLQYIWQRSLGQKVSKTVNGCTGWVHVLAAYRDGTLIAKPERLRGAWRGHLCVNSPCTARWKSFQYRPDAAPQPLVHMKECPVPEGVVAGIVPVPVAIADVADTALAEVAAPPPKRPRTEIPAALPRSTSVFNGDIPGWRPEPPPAPPREWHAALGALVYNNPWKWDKQLRCASLKLSLIHI